MLHHTSEKASWGGRRKGAGRNPVSIHMTPFPFGSLTQLPDPPGAICRGRPIHCRHKRDTRRNLIFVSRCGSWKCPYCRQALIQRWTRHIGKTTQFLDSQEGLLKLVVVFTTSAEEWSKSGRRYLRRHGAEYIRIRLRDGRLAVLSDWGEGVFLFSGEFDPEMEGMVHDYDDGLREIFSDISPERRPISTSAKWRLETERDSEESDWERVNVLTPQGFKEAESKLDKWGVPYSASRVRDKQAIDFRWPDKFTADDIVGYECNLAVPKREASGE